MSNTYENQNNKDLKRQEAISKVKELIKHNATCIFATSLEKLPITARPMAVQEVDDEGNIWFMSSKDSNKNVEINNNSKVQLFFSNTSDYEFLSVYGNAVIMYDKAKIEELWTPIAKAWFEEGKDDPKVSVIKVEPEEGYYWDTKSGKMVSMIKMLAGMITGNAPDDGVEGKITI